MELTISHEGATARRLYPAFEAIRPSPRPPPRADAFAPAHLALSGSLRESHERLLKPPGSRELFIRESLAGFSSSFWQPL